MAIRVALNHKTRYRYSRSVWLSPHVVRLRPAPHCQTPVASYSLKIQPAGHFINWQQDPYSNILARLVFPQKTAELSVEVDLVADLTVTNPFDFFLEKYAETYPFTYDPVLARELAPYRRVSRAGRQLRALIDNLRKENIRTVDYLVAVNQQIHSHIKYLIRMEPGIQTPEQTLKLRSGSCRDSGWLLVQLLRRLGMAARFVSGYLIQLAPDVKPLDGPGGTDCDVVDLHAWAEVYLPGGGWIGLDPTSGLLAGEGHIPLACSAMPATAISGMSDEMLQADGCVRPHWGPLVSMLDELGPAELQRRWHDARRMIHENGVTHNVYGDPEGLQRPWALDLVPLLVPSAEWRQLCEGLIQRAKLLDTVLADLYGSARTVRDGLLPPDLVWANPGFLRPCHGAAPPQNRWLHLYAADLVRSEEGRYEVLSDRTQAPSGAGYSLENRIVLSRTLPAPFRQCNVERLAPFFAALRATLASFAPANRDNPCIVVLTPGPFNETYFEQSFLANYLGYALVQGNDLTVREGKVYLKTVGGLQRVDVILRRVDDHFCDPLELYARSYLGVAGLLESVRQGHVVVANALGTGVLQAPGFLPFLPGLCRRLLGEELKLPSVPTWWCGQPVELGFVIDNLRELVIKSAYPTQGEDPVFGADLTRQELQALAERIKAHPEKYVAQRQVMACTVPALIDDQLQPRRFVVRPYLVACQDSYLVMNGALTRITQSQDSLVVSLQRGGGSKDTWILSDGPVNQMTLLTQQRRPIPFSRGVGDLPSRLADDLFWLGRYAERVGSQVRLARAAFDHLVEESRGRESRSGQILAAALEGGYPHPDGPTPPLQEFVQEVLGAGDGLRGVVAQVFGLTRVLRERLTPDAWRIVQELDDRVSSYRVHSEESVAGWSDLLDSMVSMIAAFLGLADDVMIGSRSWRFLDTGRRLERSIFIVRLLAKTTAQSGSEPGLLEALLEINESSFPYRRRYRMQMELHATVDLLVSDVANPRAVAFQLSRIAEHLAELPRDPARPNGDRDREKLHALLRTIQGANLLELCEIFPGGTRRALVSFLSDVGQQTGEIADAVAQVYFSHAAVPRALGTLGKENGA